MDDFWALVDRSGECWPFVGEYATTQRGYVHLSWPVLPDRYVHRTAWIETHGPIPDGLQIDHTCQNKRCCRPEHMRLVTPGEHNRITFATTCKKGHPLTEENTIKNGSGARLCGECRRDYRRRRRQAGIGT
jgi:hypothetical protein